ncbi:hypothetical protein [Pseudonocardia acaciae]|uniref:hypothetical protein n=1 Tax=Pseudonocardia acaciae TaxID=551276 RepID=UPI000490CEFE|nr:hypothetical protein [Pseudonocardia acaciae]
MSRHATRQADVVEIDDPAEAFEVFDTVCRRELGIEGREFLRRWDAGRYSGTDVDDVEGLAEVVAALSFAR